VSQQRAEDHGGAPVKITDGITIDPTQISSSARAFVGSDEILSDPFLGFISTSETTTRSCSIAHTRSADPTCSSWLIRIFAGRLPIVASLNPLSREMMVRIMTEPENSI